MQPAPLLLAIAAAALALAECSHVTEESVTAADELAGEVGEPPLDLLLSTDGKDALVLRAA